MKVEFTDSFSKSLKRLIWHESRIYKIYSIFRYGIWHFFANIWRFRKVLWNHQWWDYRYHLEAMHTSLSIMEKGMHNGMEVAESRNKKIQKIQRAIELLKNKIDDTYIVRAEAILGDVILHDWEFEPVSDHPGCSRLIDKDTPEEMEHNRKVYALAQKMEDDEWVELWEIYKGKDYNELKRLSDEITEESKLAGLDYQQVIPLTDVLYDKWFDGSGLNSWWD